MAEGGATAAKSKFQLGLKTHGKKKETTRKKKRKKKREKMRKNGKEGKKTTQNKGCRK